MKKKQCLGSHMYRRRGISVVLDFWCSILLLWIYDSQWPYSRAMLDIELSLVMLPWYNADWVFLCFLWSALCNHVCHCWNESYQIENEYGNIESSFGQRGKEYVKWAANMALGLGAGVPWVMCRQVDAPGSIVRPLSSVCVCLYASMHEQFHV